MAFGWMGKKVRLIPLDKERHFENAVRWLNDPEVTQWTLVGDFPMSRLQEQDFFERMAKLTDQPTDIGFAIETHEEEHIGFTGLHAINYRHGVATTGTIIGRSGLWNRGYGSDAMAVRSRYIFEVLGLRMALSEVMADNVGSLRALAKNGYREYGRIPARHWKRGAYRDAVLLMITREDWLRAAGQSRPPVDT